MRKKFKVEKENGLDIQKCVNNNITGSEKDLEFAVICEWNTDWNYFLCNKADLPNVILESLPDAGLDVFDTWSVRAVNKEGEEVDWREISTIKINRY